MSAGIDPAIVGQAIERNLHKIQSCYDKQLQATPGLNGTITTNFAINTNGVVTRASATGLDDVDDCVASVIKTIEFPKPDKGSVVVVYPFTFAPRAN
jgi:hypothetical protein